MAFLDNSGAANLVADLQEKIKASFAKKSHSHAISDVANLQDTLDRKAPSSIPTDTAIAAGDKLVITDSSDGSKLKRSGIAFGSDTTTFLRNDGTWASPPSLPSVSASDNGKVLRVVNGAWAAASLPSASGVSF